jgi:hypothetical protein
LVLELLLWLPVGRPYRGNLGDNSELRLNVVLHPPLSESYPGQNLCHDYASSVRVQAVLRRALRARELQLTVCPAPGDLAGPPVLLSP